MKLRVNHSWEVLPTIWAGIVAPSGSNKSAALNLVKAPVEAIQKSLRSTYDDKMKDHRKSLATWKSVRNNPVPEPEPPVFERVTAGGDATVEAVLDILSKNPRGITVAVDELALFFGGMNAYQPKGQTGLSKYLSLHDGGTVYVDRKGAGNTYIHSGCISIAGNIQPEILLQYLTPENLTSGLIPRFLFVMPPERDKVLRREGISPYVESPYNSMIRALWSIKPIQRQSDKYPQSHSIKLSDKAYEAFDQFYREWGKIQKVTTGFERSLFAKLEAYCLKFALINHITWQLELGEDPLDPIGVPSIQAGIELVKWFAHEITRVVRSLKNVKASEALDEFMEKVRARGGSITRRDAKRLSRNWDDSQVEEFFISIVKNGLGTLIAEAPPSGGRAVETLTLGQQIHTPLSSFIGSSDPSPAPFPNSV